MPNYRRSDVRGGTFFFTVVTHGRRGWLCSDVARAALRGAIVDVRARYPFTVEAFVLLPDHLHCLWTLPEGDRGFAARWRLIKSGVTRWLGRGGGTGAGVVVGASAVADTPCGGPMTASRERRKERGLWQRRFWEHTIRDERDFKAHCDYIHYNPVKHGLVAAPKDWPFSTFHKFVAGGMYPENWGGVPPEIADGVGHE